MRLQRTQGTATPSHAMPLRDNGQIIGPSPGLNAFWRQGILAATLQFILGQSFLPSSVRNISEHDVRQPINARMPRNNLPDNVRYVAVAIPGAHVGWILRACHDSLYHEAVPPLLPLVCV